MTKVMADVDFLWTLAIPSGIVPGMQSSASPQFPPAAVPGAPSRATRKQTDAAGRAAKESRMSFDATEAQRDAHEDATRAVVCCTHCGDNALPAGATAEDAQRATQCDACDLEGAWDSDRGEFVAVECEDDACRRCETVRTDAAHAAVCGGCCARRAA